MLDSKFDFWRLSGIFFGFVLMLRDFGSDICMIFDKEGDGWLLVLVDCFFLGVYKVVVGSCVFFCVLC